MKVNQNEGEKGERREEVRVGEGVGERKRVEVREQGERRRRKEEFLTE